MKKHLFLFILMLSPMLASAVDVKIDETTFPDSNFRNWVLSQEYGADGVLTNEELENVTSLEINRLEIHDLKGIEYFIALKVLNCMTNKLTALDLSKNIALEKLECVGNRLTTINLLENSKLRLLSCVSNQLTTLDVSGCTELDTLACSGNQLTALNVSMNTKLISLECYGNQLSTLDLSRNTALRRIHCNANQLTTLDVSKNTALTMLQCSSNLLTTLDVTKNSAITSLSCTDNKLITLYMSNNKSLESITCFRNQLTSLDASGCSALKTLNCTDNQLTTLDLSGCSVLEEVYCNDNQLSTLDLSENTALTRLSCYHNQIKGAGMDALVESLHTMNGGSLNVVYFENEQNVMTTTQVAVAKAKGWTPYLCAYDHPKEYAGQEVSPYGEWWLIGWSDGGTYFEVDPNYVSHRHFSIEIPIEGSVMAYSMANSLYLGLLTLNGNEMIFGGEKFMTQVYCDIKENQFFEDHIWDIKSYQLEGNLLKLYYTDNDYFVFTSDLNNHKEAGNDYRPFVEDGKVWKVGNTQAILDNSVQVVDYYYFDGDTIIGGKTCKQMMCQRFVGPGFSDEYGYWTPQPFLKKVGAWYEEDQKVYFYDEITQSLEMKYDFSLAANDTLKFLTDWSSPFIIGPKQTGGIEGFKGVYRDIRMCGDEGQSYHDTFWLEGVGCLRGPLSNPCDPILADPVPEFVMSCVVGDEVIYYNDDREDGATPAGARKNRFDFTHTTKIKPKARMRSEEEPSLYGEFNDQKLDINLGLLDDTYQVCITDGSGKAVYEKTINAGSIVALDIDISAYAKGRYTVTVENGRESFTGEFETQATGISDAVRLNNKERMINDKLIYNLQGQRLNSLQKGLNIVNGRKIYVK
jgi:hypothetical protein